MISFLPDVPVSPRPLATAGAAPLAKPEAAMREGSAGIGFAGLLRAAMPAGNAAAQIGSDQSATVPLVPAPTPNGPALNDPAPLTPALTPAIPRLSDLAPLPEARLPIGTILPDNGAALPEAVAPVMGDSSDGLPESLMPGSIPTPIAPDGTLPVAVLEVQPQPAEEAEAIPPSPPELEDSDGIPPAPIAVPVAAVALAPSTPPPSALMPVRPVARAVLHPAAPPAHAEDAPLPERVALPAASNDSHSASTPATLLVEAAPAAATAQLAPIPTNAPLAPATTAAPPMAERAETRAPATSQESTIAQVGELREALRTVRPELTVRHTDFGFVSLRLEAAGAQDWRAVLASRDPGFVPAVQAALAERAIAATAETAGTGTGTGTGTGQNGTSDHRSGSSPSGGQGSSQPYLAQSSGRDEGGQQHPQQRQPRTTDAVAARAGESDAASADRRDRGVFA